LAHGVEQIGPDIKTRSVRKIRIPHSEGSILTPPPERRIHPADRRAALGLPDESGIPIGIAAHLGGGVRMRPYGDMIIMGTSREKCLNCLGFCRAHVPIISWGPAVAIASITNEWHRTASQPEPAFNEDY
jgi:hypothetical protein